MRHKTGAAREALYRALLPRKEFFIGWTNSRSNRQGGFGGAEPEGTQGGRNLENFCRKILQRKIV
jgi:hypothetical protein